jgi:HKD family nuclease
MEITILYIIVCLLTISNIFFIWRGTKLVKELEEREFYFNDMELEVSNTLEKMLNEMKEIDIRGSFESDDEVGVVFGELKDLVEKYKNNL